MSIRTSSSALVLSLVAACSSAPTPPPQPQVAPAPEPAPAPDAAAPQAAQERTVERITVFQGRVGGRGTTKYLADGGIEFSYQHVENGRGPKIDGRVRLAADGTVAAFEAKGSFTFGAPIDEAFSVEDGVARWNSTTERGEHKLDGPAFYVPMAPWPEVQGLLFDALQRAGGELALLPAGRATLTRVGEASVPGPDGEPVTLVAWHIAGLEFLPETVWADADNHYIGRVDEYRSYLDVRWQGAIAALVAAQKEYARARDAALVKEHATHPPDAGLAIVGARVLDVRRGRWRADHTVLVKGDRIVAVGPSRRTKPPAGAMVIDAGGKALIPGLWDMHAHLGDAEGPLNIASGVTTVRDLGNDPDYLDEVRKRYDAGEAIGPHVHRSGFIEGRGPNSASSKVKAETEEEAREAVEFYAKRGYSGIKIYNSMKAELVPVLAKLAHDKGMRVSGHVPVFMRARDVVVAGYDEIQHINMLFLNFLVDDDTDTRTLARFTLVAEHGLEVDFDSKPVRDFMKLLKRKRIVIDPTVATFEDMFTARQGEVPAGIVPLVERLPIQAQRYFRGGGLAKDAAQVKKYRAVYAHMLALVRRLHESGIRIVPGTDTIAGLWLHRELALYVQAGISTADVLRIATVGAAQVLKQDRDVGTIERGKVADLVLVDGDPLANIEDVAKTVTVIRAGTVYDAAALYRIVGVAPR